MGRAVQLMPRGPRSGVRETRARRMAELDFQSFAGKIPKFRSQAPPFQTPVELGLGVELGLRVLGSGFKEAIPPNLWSAFGPVIIGGRDHA